MNKKYKILIAIGIFILAILILQKSVSAQLRVITIGQGGTGTSTTPAYGEMLIGNALGTYDLTTNFSAYGTTTAPFGIAGNTVRPMLTVDARTGFTGNLLNLKTASTTYFSVSATGTITASNLTASRLVATDASKKLVTTITSANLASSISNETGSGAAVFGTAPTFTTSITVTGGGSFSTRLGVGTSTIPAAHLAVVGSAQIGATRPMIYVDTRSTYTGNILDLRIASTTVMAMAGTTGNVGIGSSTPKSVLSISTNAQSAPTTKLFTVASTTGASLFTVLAGGNVGVGKSPSYLLDVNGIINGTAIYEGGSPFVGSQWTTNVSDIYYNNDTPYSNVGIGSTTTMSRLAIVGGVANNEPYIVADAPTLFLGNLLDLKVGSTTKFFVDYEGSATVYNLTVNNTMSLASDLTLHSGAGLNLSNVPDDASVVIHNTATDAGVRKLAISTAADDVFVIDNNRYIGIGGTSTPYSILSVAPETGGDTTEPQYASTAKLFTVASSTGVSLLTVLGSGNVGIGTSTPMSRLSVSTPVATPSTNHLVTFASTTNKIIAQWDANGKWRIGDGRSATSTNLLQYNAASGTVDVLTGLNLGQLTSPTNPGIFTFYNVPVNSSSADNTVHSATFAMDSTSLMTWYALSDGAGSVDNLRVGIGTSSPAVLLHIEDPVAGATSTIQIGRNNNTKGGCISISSPNGTWYRIRISNAGTLTATAGKCGSE